MDAVINQLKLEFQVMELDDEWAELEGRVSVYTAGNHGYFETQFIGYKDNDLFDIVNDRVFADYAPMVQKQWGIAQILGMDMEKQARLRCDRIQTDFKKAMVAQRDTEIAYKKMVYEAMWDGTDLCEDVMGVIVEYL